MTILCLCREEHHWKLIPGYAAAFRARGIEFVCVGQEFAPDSQLEAILRTLPVRPSAIFHFESTWPLLPQGLVQSEIPTVCFQADTYAFTRKRIRWSCLFDHAAVFHPGYDEMFIQAGHPGAFLLPHAVRRDYYDGPEMEREFEVGWVGQSTGVLYRKRAKCLPELSGAFRTNDLSRSYTPAEVAEIYRRSRIVVNVGRDDYPQDANLRVFEALASGALLITSLPTELTSLGFQEGVHFIGYREDREILPLVKQMLERDNERIGIGNTARTKALREHTYDNRVQTLLDRLSDPAWQYVAPARHRPEHRARFIYLDYYASHRQVASAGSEFRRIAGRDFRETLEGGLMIGKAWTKDLFSKQVVA